MSSHVLFIPSLPRLPHVAPASLGPLASSLRLSVQFIGSDAEFHSGG